MNVLTKLEATLVFLGTSYVSSNILSHKLMVGLVNHISVELEPNKCIVHRHNCVKYITYFNESSFTKFITHFTFQY